MKILCVVMCAALLVVGGAGVALCLSPSPRTLKEASKKRWKTVNIEAKRGDIFDRNGRRLATSLQVPDVQLNPKRVPMDQIDALADRLGPVLGEEPKALAAKLRQRKKLQPNNQHMVLKKRVHPKVEHAVRQLRNSDKLVKGSVNIHKRYQRYYPEWPFNEQVQVFVNQNVHSVGLDNM